MVSLMNGLSAMGGGIATFAQSAGLEAQKADLAQKGMVLADQLAHTSKTAEISQTGSIAATAAEAEQGYKMTQLATTTASAEKVAGIGAEATTGAAGITAGAMLEATKIQTGQSAKNIAEEIAARSADVLTQTASAKAISDQQIAASVKTSELVTGTNRQNILDELTAHSGDITKQLAAAGNEITIDATTGNSIIVNKQTGTVTPLKGIDGEPLKLPNTAMVQALQATINTTNEELRARNIQYSTDVKAAEADAERTAQRSDLFGEEKTAAINEARGNVQTVKNQYTNILNSLNERMQASAAALLSMQGVKMDGPAPVAPVGVPPGAHFSANLKIWQSPDGRVFDQQGKPTAAPGSTPGVGINQNSQQ